MTDYTDVLDLDTTDLVAEAEAWRITAPSFRDGLVADVLKLVDARKSVLLVGPSGVGKTAVLHGVAYAMADRAGGGHVFATSTTRVMSRTRYLGEWQTKVAQLVRSARDKGGAVYLSDLSNLDSVGRTAQTSASLLDALRPSLEDGSLVLIGEATPEQVRAMGRTPRFTSLFTQVLVPPLSAEDADAIVCAHAEAHGAPLDEACTRTLNQVTARFMPASHPPGPALTLLARVLDYQREKAGVGEPTRVTPAFIEHVFSIYSGLPKFVVSASETKPAHELRSWFQDRLVGQREAIEAVVETIALFKAGLHDPGKPLGSFLFVGPTGVGKTELARLLAELLFGSRDRLLRFDMSEFKDYHAFEMLVGDPKHPEKPAALIDPVRAQPFQVVLFDELEKAHPNVWDLFLQLLDDGRLTPPGGEAVDFRSTIVIATSNAGAQEGDRSLGFAADVAAGRSARDARVRGALEAAFRPEFLNRFQHLVVFHPLTRDELQRVARQELKRVLGRSGLTERNLVVDVTDEALDVVIAGTGSGRWGARALKREIQRQIALPLAMTLLERPILPGTLLRVTVKDGAIRATVHETPESRAERRAADVARAADEQRASDEELGTRVAAMGPRVEALAAGVREAALVARRGEIELAKAAPDFWRDEAAAAQALGELSHVTATLARVEHLRAIEQDLRDAHAAAVTRGEREHVGRDLARLERLLGHAERELLRLGRAGDHDALVWIRPVPGGEPRLVRDLLARLYTGWAELRDLEARWVADPLSDDEPALLRVSGPFAYGLLAREAGLHRARDGERHGTCLVRVGPVDDPPATPRFTELRALKTAGQLGGKVRSRLACESGLVIQNGATLADNREAAAELEGAWLRLPEAPELTDPVVRRYDLDPPRLRDTATGVVTARSDVFSPRALHELLLARVDAALPPPTTGR